MLAGLVERLIAHERELGEEELATRLGMKLRMWRYVKAGSYGLSTRALRAALRNFPQLQEEVVDYLTSSNGADTRGVAA